MLLAKTSIDWMVVGLGNPGANYDGTRHNVGFQALDRMAGTLGCRVDRAKFQALTGQTSYQGRKLLLVKPQTFMNNSGQAVKAAAAYYRIPPERILVIFDDISLPVGRVRIREDGSAGGHNGIKSIIAHLGSQSFPRVKIGVGEKPNPEYDLADWVLGRFSALERKDLEPALERGVQGALTLMTQGYQTAASQCNGK